MTSPFDNIGRPEDREVRAAKLVVWQQRRDLWTAGYRPVAVYGVRNGFGWGSTYVVNGVKVTSPGKQPVGKGWQDRARLDPPDCVLTEPAAFALNTGVLCDGLRAIDVDIDHRETADAVAALARSLLGGAPVRGRSNNSPRRLLLYRSVAGEPGKRRTYGGGGAVEVLGYGQQFVAYGAHPQGGTYEWNLPDWMTYGRDALTPITEEQVTRFLDAVASLPAPQGAPGGWGQPQGAASAPQGFDWGTR